MCELLRVLSFFEKKRLVSLFVALRVYIRVIWTQLRTFAQKSIILSKNSL